MSEIDGTRIGVHLPPLQTLRAFEAAARHLSYTRAAEELALTHGAVSHHIAALERRLGTKLFLRRGHRMLLTEDGQVLVAQIRQGLRMLERAIVAAARGRTAATAARHAEPLTVSVLPSFAARWLIPRLSGFQAAHPGIDIQLRPSAALATLDGDGIDAAIRYGHGGWGRLRSERLMGEMLFPVCSPAYRGGDLPRRSADLARATLLLNPRQPWRPWFAAAGLDRPEPEHGPSYEDAAMLLQAAAAGQGIALARAALAEDDLRSGRLVRLFDVAIPDEYAYFVVWRPGGPRQNAVDAFRRWLVAEVAAIMPAPPQDGPATVPSGTDGRAP